ncbi:hypothetical protein JCM8547_008864 [Rhodosporidiobolus lusitaniae]
MVKIAQKLVLLETVFKERHDVVPLALPKDAPAVVKSGRWTIKAEGKASHDRYSLVWEDVETVLLAHYNLTVEVRKFGSHEVLWREKVDKFPATKSGSVSSPLVPQANVVRIELEIEQKEVEQVELVVGPEDVAPRFAELTRRPTPFDVRLFFPRHRQELWAPSSLIKKSPYLCSLLSSDFSECTIRVEDDRLSRLSVPPACFEDSDDELDATLPKPFPRPFPAFNVPPHKTITVTEASYSTYLAVVSWMFTGQIAFTPLSSSATGKAGKRVRNSTVKEKRQGVVSFPPLLHSSLSSFPSPPSSPLPPVSPKSVYRLADLLELPDLSSLALSNFRSQVTVSNAAVELFTDISSYYDPVCHAVLDFVDQEKGRLGE